jgi:hypothetical protein
MPTDDELVSRSCVKCSKTIDGGSLFFVRPCSCLFALLFSSSFVFVLLLLNRTITGVVVTAVGKSYHPDCFACYGCRKVIDKVRCCPHSSSSACLLLLFSLFSRSSPSSWLGFFVLSSATSSIFSVACRSSRVVSYPSGQNTNTNNHTQQDGAFDMYQNQIYHPNCVPAEALPTCKVCVVLAGCVVVLSGDCTLNI